MRVVLISPYDNVVATGVRVLSSYLKLKGHSVNIVFLPFEHKGAIQSFDYAYPNDVLNSVLEICNGASLVGISLTTNYFHRCVELTGFLKLHLKVPVVWGGIHPTLCPEECLEHADFVLIGESENAFVELVSNLEKNKGVNRTHNLCYKKNGRVVMNSLFPLIKNLDSLPDPDYDLDGHYVLKDGKIVPMTHELLKEFMWVEAGLRKHLVFTSRGCPHSCSYCCNSGLRKYYIGQNYIRKRSPERVIRELENITKKFNFIESIGIGDESFFVQSEDDIRKFTKLYKEKINLPLQVEFSPFEYDGRKFELLIDAGLVAVQMGVQSGSEHTNEHIYNRKQSKSRIAAVANDISRHSSKLKYCCFHFIVGNPLETNENIKETIKFALLELPDFYMPTLYPLTFYPGAKITERAIESGVVNSPQYDSGWNVQRYKEMNYLTYVFKLLVAARNRGLLRNKVMARSLVSILTSDAAVFTFDRKLFLRLLYYCLVFYSKVFHSF